MFEFVFVQWCVEGWLCAQHQHLSLTLDVVCCICTSVLRLPVLRCMYVQFMATVHQYSPPSDDQPHGRRVMYVKGAPDRLFPLCCSQLVDDSLEAITDPKPHHSVAFQEGFWVQAQEQLSSQGLRVLALCRCASIFVCDRVVETVWDLPGYGD